MANRRYVTPEQERSDNDEAQKAQQRANQVAERIKFRNAAQKLGISGMPDPSAIHDMSDADWLSHEQRAGRQGFFGVGENGRPLPAPAVAPLVPRPSVAVVGPDMSTRAGRLGAVFGTKQPLDSVATQTGAGLVANVGGRSVAVQPNAEQAMNIATGGKWATMSPGERTAHLRANPATTPQGTVLPTPNGVLPAMSADEMRGIEARYGGGVRGTVRQLPASAPGYINGVQVDGLAPAGGAAPVRSAPAPVVAPVPTGIAPTIGAGISVAGAKPDPVAAGAGFGRPMLTDITKGEPAFALPPDPPSAATQAGQAVRAALPHAADASAFPPRVPGTRGESALQPMAGRDAIVQGVSDFATGVADGKATAAGVSRSQAAGFEQPSGGDTKPVTPTTPAPDVDRSKESIARFGQTDEDWKNRRLAFSGF